MQGPLILPCSEVLDLSRGRPKKGKSRGEDSERRNASLTEKVSGGRGRQAMRRIVESITKLQESRDFEETREELGEFELRVPLELIGEDENSKCEVRMPWMSQEKVVFRRMKKERVATAAELSLDEMVVKRLRNEARKMRTWVKGKKAGVTQKHGSSKGDIRDCVVLVSSPKQTYIRVLQGVMAALNFCSILELFLLKNKLILFQNELKLLKSAMHIKYFGYDIAALHLFQFLNNDEFGHQSIVKILNLLILEETFKNAHVVDTSSLHVNVVKPEGCKTALSGIQQDEVTQAGNSSIHEFIGENLELQSVSGTLYEREADRLLNGLGPRFVDWWWPKPLPVDADLLPEVIPGFMTPYRCCPPRVEPKLTDDELTNLRKFARYLPTHFALVQLLALQHLTGGVLILRNKFFIIFFRGKDFLPSEVANLVLARERELERCQLYEEGARCKPINSHYEVDEIIATSSSGTFSEFKHMKTKYGTICNETEDFDIQMETEKEKLQRELEREERRLFILNKKIAKSAKELSKLNSEWEPAEQYTDLEMITEEERQCLRKIGLKVNKILMLGRRGIFDGVIGNMHLHWKHREIVKVITMQKTVSQVNYTARQLEVESGGILIAIEKLRNGYAIILYRGKNYQRPLNLLPGNLLKKKAALRRSLELQRIGEDLQDGDATAAP
ncbi:hypothetical protein Scep_023060 [Stephania cephalantha]|uniref:CRM domain-containing protein n=1 Tax=Stephania cephalantha TaxID=152367 RepID=A0AAP0I2M3_9MAGN